MGRLIAKKLSTGADKKKPHFDRWALGPAGSGTAHPMSELQGSAALSMLFDWSSMMPDRGTYRDTPINGLRRRNGRVDASTKDRQYGR